jgi:uncharacterized protein YcbK (DUF882 family)
MFVRSPARRTFLKLSLAGMLGLYGLSGTARAGEEDSLVQPIPPGELTLYNTHTDERLTVAFRDSAGAYDLSALGALNHLLRCHYTNEQTDMDVCTLEYLNQLDKELGGGHEIHIISGYRSPRYNELLISKGHRVARHSLHLSGRAIDVAFPSVNLPEVRRAALGLRRGGVGYYPGDGFVHLDSGSYRSW